jgi:hypothetical protein
MPQTRNTRRDDARIAYYERCATCTNTVRGADATRRIRPPASRPVDAALAATLNRASEGAVTWTRACMSQGRVHPRHGTRGTRWRGRGERAMIVQDDDVQAARSEIAEGRLRGDARPRRDRPPDFSSGWPAWLPTFVDPGRDAVKRARHALDRSLERPSSDGCTTADRDRLDQGRVERTKDKAP